MDSTTLTPTQTLRATSPVRLVVHEVDRVGESPVWDARRQCLYWVDIEGRRIHRWNWPEGPVRTWKLSQRPGCIALTDGSPQTIVAAMEDGIYSLALQDGDTAQATLLATVEHPAQGMRFNDGRCDSAGRLWVGSMVMNMALAKPEGSLYCLDECGLHGPVRHGYITPNGSAFSPDGRTMYWSDSHPQVQTVWSAPFDPQAPAERAMGVPQTFIDFGPLPGRPDGAAVDSQGNYWICGNDEACVHAFSPAGQRLLRIDLPVPKPAMCAFGGPDLKTLFITSIVPAQPAPGDLLSGGLFAVNLNVAGQIEPRFTRFPTPLVSTHRRHT